VPSFISFVINEEPPTHLDKFTTNYIFHDPEIDAGEHHDHDVNENFWEYDRHEEITICKLVSIKCVPNNSAALKEQI